jgi:hypothetical protein
MNNYPLNAKCVMSMDISQKIVQNPLMKFLLKRQSNGNIQKEKRTLDREKSTQIPFFFSPSSSSLNPSQPWIPPDHPA